MASDRIVKLYSRVVDQVIGGLVFFFIRTSVNVTPMQNIQGDVETT